MCLIRSILCFTVIFISIPSPIFTVFRHERNNQLDHRHASKNGYLDAQVINRRPTHKFTQEYSDSGTSSATSTSSDSDSVGRSIFRKMRLNYQLSSIKDRRLMPRSRRKSPSFMGGENRERRVVGTSQEAAISTRENEKNVSHRQNWNLSALDIDKGNYHTHYSSDGDNGKTRRRQDSKKNLKRTSDEKHKNVHGTGTRENRKKAQQHRQNLNLPALDINKITGDYHTYYSSSSDDDVDDDGTPRRQDSKNILKRSSAEKYRNAHGTDGSWAYAKNLQKRNKLNDFCTSVQLVSGYGFAFVNDGHLVKGFLRLGEIEILADIVRFTSNKKSTKRIFYMTKGLRPDCVFLLSVQDPEANLFSLGKHFCYITGPTPLHKNQK